MALKQDIAQQIQAQIGVWQGADQRVQRALMVGHPPQRQAGLHQAATELREQVACGGGKPPLTQEPVDRRKGMLLRLRGRSGGLGHYSLFTAPPRHLLRPMPAWMHVAA